MFRGDDKQCVVLNAGVFKRIDDLAYAGVDELNFPQQLIAGCAGGVQHYDDRRPRRLRARRHQRRHAGDESAFLLATVSSQTTTAQVAPTILKALGLDPSALDAVRIEGTAVLPEVAAQLDNRY